MLHEERNRVSEKTVDRKRAIDSLREELEAIDWYAQRMDATRNKELKTILQHNMDEEKEHAAMLLEWIRRNDPHFNKMLKKKLFISGKIVAKEKK